ncbi:UNVERIFIED_ORG: hypothetical protein ABIB19_000103 [Arthrobacter sp. UYEF10]
MIALALESGAKSVATPCSGAWGDRAPAVGPGETAPPVQRRNGLSEKTRALWLLIPGGLLMTLVILIPLAMGIRMFLIDLDQYTVAGLRVRG